MTPTERQKDIERWAGNFSAEDIPILQGRILQMIDPEEASILAHSAVEQPADFYIDTRVGKLRYPKRAILKAVAILARVAKNAGLDPHHLKAPRALNFRLY